MKSISLLILTVVTISIAIPFTTKDVVESDQKLIAMAIPKRIVKQDCDWTICNEFCPKCFDGCCPNTGWVCCPCPDYLCLPTEEECENAPKLNGIFQDI